MKETSGKLYEPKLDSENEYELDEYTIVLRNLSLKISKEDLRRLFKDCGEIKKIQVIKKPKKLVDAKIIFDNKEAVKKVIYSIQIFYLYLYLNHRPIKKIKMN